MSKAKKAWKGTVAKRFVFEEDSFIPRNRSQAILHQAAHSPDTSVLFAIGPAGGGKSFVPLYAAFELVNQGDIKKIIVFRPRTASARKEFGAVTGGAREKMQPYVGAINTNIEKITGFEASVWEDKKLLVLQTPDFVRGETFDNTFMIADEAQNFTKNEIALLLTRIGKGSKIVFTGDISRMQNDLEGQEPGLVKILSCLGEYAQDNAKADINTFSAFVRFNEEDSAARNEILPDLLKAMSRMPRGYIPHASANKHESRSARQVENNCTIAMGWLTKMAEQTTKRFWPLADAKWPGLAGNNVAAFKGLTRKAG